MLGLGSWAVQSRIERAAREDMGEALVTVLDTTQQAMRSWFKEQTASAAIWASRPEVLQNAVELLRLPHDPESLMRAPPQAGLRAVLNPVSAARGYRGYFVVGPDNINLASSRDSNLGVPSLLIEQKGFLDRVRAGETALSLPQVSDVLLPDETGKLAAGLATMFVGAPVRDGAGRVIAILAFRIDPSSDFSAILQRGRIGKSGETYAFDAQGQMISESRFIDQLRDVGLVESTNPRAFIVELRDPGVNLVLGERTDLPRERQPLTRMARSALAGESGKDVEGYRDYRGVHVIGAWLWDDEMNFGIVTEGGEAGHVPGEGYAVLYVNGSRTNRITGPDFTLGPLPEGVHDLRVGLYANDHRAYGGDDGRLSAHRVVILVNDEGQAFPPVAHAFDLSIVDGRLADGEDTIRVAQGEVVALHWSVDEPTELHLHGYDIEMDAGPEVHVTMLFVAYAAGRYPVNQHGAAGEGVAVYLEVLP